MWRIADKKDLKGFFRSIRLGQVDNLRYYIEKNGIDINTKDEWDNSPLYLACLCGHKSTVKYLLEKGAHYDSNSIESQRCFLSSLTQGIRDVLKSYESSLVVDSSQSNVADLKFVDYLGKLYENVPDHDIELIVKDEVYLAHRCILSVRCPYFAVRLKEIGNEEQLILTERQFKPCVFGPMLRFIYTGRLDVEKRHKQELIALARFLHFNSLKETLEQDKSLLMIRHQQFVKDLKSDFDHFVSSAIPPSLIPPSPGEPDFDDRGTYSDVVFDVQGHSFKCHKIFFYGRSEYFREMLIDRGEEQPPAFGDYSPRIRLENISAEIFVEIVHFIYTDNYTVNDNGIQLLKAGRLFLIPQIQKKCMKEITKSQKMYMYPTNVCDIYQYAVDLDLQKLKNVSLSYMANEFEQVIVFPEFETFIRHQLSPLMKEGTPFDQISFFMDLQYYLRGECHTWEEKNAANQNIQKLNYLLTHKIGVDVSLPLLDVPADSEPPAIVVGSYDRNMDKGPEDFKGFFTSIRLGNLDDLRCYVERRGIYINTKDEWDNSALYLACLCGHEKTVKYLLERGASYAFKSKESQQYFLSSLNQGIRDVLKMYESSLVVKLNQSYMFDLELVDFMEKLYENLPDPDVKLIVKNQMFSAHSCILSVRCQYFDAKLQNCKKDRPLKIALPKVFTLEAFGPMLRFIYTGRMDVGKQHRQCVIALAKFLKFYHLAQVLEDIECKVSYEGDFMIRHQQSVKELKSDFDKLASSAIPSSLPLIPPVQGEPGAEDNTLYSDVVFDVQGHFFKCHKIFFYGRSEYFRQMLIDRGEEQPPALGDNSPCIKLENISPDIFVQVVHFMYTDNCTVDDNCIQLLKAGRLFLIPKIQKKCMQEVCTKYIYPTNVCEIYQYAIDLDLQSQKNICLNYIASNLEQVIVFLEFETFIRHQLSPLMKEGTPFDQIPFFMELQYRLRERCHTWARQNSANQKLQKFNYLLKHKIGADVSLILFDIPAESEVVQEEETQQEEIQPEQTGIKKKKKQGCCIL